METNEKPALKPERAYTYATKVGLYLTSPEGQKELQTGLRIWNGKTSAAICAIIQTQTRIVRYEALTMIQDILLTHDDFLNTRSVIAKLVHEYKFPNAHERAHLGAAI